MTRGYASANDADEQPSLGQLTAWEAIAVDAVGHVIDFWSFKRNQGRVWGVLYLRDSALTAQQIQDALGLSKGAVSMITRELEQWGVLVRVREPADASWRFAAERNLMQMIGRVLDAREGAMVRRVRHDLERALDLATRAAQDARAGKPGGPPPVAPAALERLRRMVRLAELVQGAIETFARTVKLDFGSAIAALLPAPLRRPR